jgi:hypothetical protein
MPIAMPIGSTPTEPRSVTNARRGSRPPRCHRHDALQHRCLRQREPRACAAQSITMNCSVAPAPQNSVVVASEIWPSWSRHSSDEQCANSRIRYSGFLWMIRWSTPVSGMNQLNSAAMQ